MVKMDFIDGMLSLSKSEDMRNIPIFEKGKSVLPFETRSVDKSQLCRSIKHPRTGDGSVDTRKGVCSGTG